MSNAHYSTSQLSLNPPAISNTSSVFRNDPAVTIVDVDQLSSSPDDEPLGIIAKLPSTKNDVSAHYETVIRRFELLTTVWKLLPGSRTAKCQHDLVPTSDHVDIVNGRSNRPRYRKLQRCESVWVCPFCSAVITEQRRNELNEAIYQRAAGLGLSPCMVTLTHSHHAGMTLQFQLNMLCGRSRVTGARNFFLSGRKWVEIETTYGIVGDIWALEILDSVRGNGWHPHIHMILMLDRQLDEKARMRLESTLRKRWIDALQKASRKFGQPVGASWERACKVTTDNKNIADYVAKFGKLPAKEWTLATELTKAQVKHRSEGYNIWELIEHAGDGDQQAAAKVREYAAATKGKTQLHWSKGLRKLLKVEEKPDADVIQEAETEALQLLAQIDRSDWYKILRANKRGEVLRELALHGFDAMQRVLSELGAMAIRPANEDSTDGEAQDEHDSETVQNAPEQAQSEAHKTKVTRYMQRDRVDLSEWHVTGKIPIRVIDRYEIDRADRGDPA